MEISLTPKVAVAVAPLPVPPVPLMFASTGVIVTVGGLVYPLPGLSIAMSMAMPIDKFNILA